MRRYKQNTHGGGIRDPLVISWRNGISARGELRHAFAHATDFTPTVLDILGLEIPQTIAGVPQMPLEGQSFAASFKDPDAQHRTRPQYFEMFGHRGLWKEGWKAVAFHPPGQPFDKDVWELYHLDADFAETQNLAESQKAKLDELVAAWWSEAERCKVLPLDDRFGPRFAENALRYHGDRKRFVFHKGMGHLPTDVAPDVRSRSYRIEAEAFVPPEGAEGVLLSHGDATCGYSFYLQGGRLNYTINVGGALVTVTSEAPVPAGHHRLSVGVHQDRDGRRFVLAVDGKKVGEVHTHLGFANFISWSGLDIGLDRGSPVAGYDAPFCFTGKLSQVVVTMDDDQVLDGDAIGEAEMARQ